MLCIVDPMFSRQLLSNNSVTVVPLHLMHQKGCQVTSGSSQSTRPCENMAHTDSEHGVSMTVQLKTPKKSAAENTAAAESGQNDGNVCLKWVGRVWRAINGNASFTVVNS